MNFEDIKKIRRFEFWAWLFAMACAIIFSIVTATPKVLIGESSDIRSMAERLSLIVKSYQEQFQEISLEGYIEEHTKGEVSYCRSLNSYALGAPMSEQPKNPRHASVTIEQPKEIAGSFAIAHIYNPSSEEGAMESSCAVCPFLNGRASCQVIIGDSVLLATEFFLLPLPLSP